MSILFAAFLKDILESAFSTIDSAFLWVLEGMFHVETLMGGAFTDYITSASISAVFNFIYTLAAGLVALKFLFKGFMIYILWRDGDADASPQDMLVGSIQAIVVTLLFPTLYEMMSDVTVQLARYVMRIFGIGEEGAQWLPVAALTATNSLGLVELIFLLIFIVLSLVLTVKLIGRGFELLVLRLGVPFACIGLVDSDGGAFKSYMQIFYKTMFTSVIQVVLLSLAFRVITGMNMMSLIGGISLVSTAFSTPMLMQQILVPVGRGGGVTNKVYSGAMAVNTIRNLIGK